MKTLQQRVEYVKTKGQKAFVPYVMAGDGDLKKQLLHLQQKGATAIEVGIPFSDPVADGPIIQEAGQRALQNGANLTNILHELATLQQTITTPIVIMTYFNPIVHYGIEKFVQAASAANVKGLIIPDLPIEEADCIQPFFKETDIALVQLISLTSPIERIKKLSQAAEGFIYAVTVNGITGTQKPSESSLHDHFATLQQIATIPVLAGFGISTKEHVQQMNQYVDGVIVGSAIVQAFHDNDETIIDELFSANQLSIH